MKKKVLMLVPAVTARGGITNYFNVLKNKFTTKVEYFIRGSRTWPKRKNVFYESIRFIVDIFSFIVKISKNKYHILQTSTSLSSYSVIRDGIFIILAKIFRIKIIVFFRGWDPDFWETIKIKYSKYFQYIYFRKVDAILVLSSDIKKEIINFGYNGLIFVESTVADESLVTEFKFNSFEKELKNKESINLLYLARVEKQKGIYLTIDAFILLKPKFKNLKLYIAGDGSEYESIINKYKDNKDIEILGFISSEEKKKYFCLADIYIFPTSHNEGMPNSVLEAMLFGLPVITSPIGGIVDIIRERENGMLLKSFDSNEIAQLIEILILDNTLREKISLNNFNESRKKYTTTQVIDRLESIYNSLD